ncbi:MAG: phosphoribosylanthranilate isomerase [Desulfuromonas sp.]|nr:MAG: phosphoribosylanthranilate isomerase [Desulfuromonas sp.]
MTVGSRVKLCGTARRTDAELAAAAGADWFGVVIETAFSPRSLAVEEAKPLFTNPPLPPVALVFEMPEARLQEMIETLHPFAVQFLAPADVALLGRLKANWPTLQLWQSLHLPPAGEKVDLSGVGQQVETYLQAGVDLLLFDTAATVAGTKKFGGTGLTADWGVIRAVLDSIRGRVPVLLAGGVRPENVYAGLCEVLPDGVDLCSGVESTPGSRDPLKVAALMAEVKRWNSERKG